MAVRVDRPGLEKCIKVIDDAIKELSEAASKIERTMTSEIPDYWEGNAHDKAQSTYDQEYRKLLTKTLPEAVTSFKDYIDQCKNTIIEIDEQLSGS